MGRRLDAGLSWRSVERLVSYLLCLHGVSWSTFESAFRAKKPAVAAVVKAMNLPHLQQYVFPKLTDEKAKALVTKTLSNGIDYSALSPADARVLDVIVDRAFRTKKLGIRTAALSPMGIGAQWLDDLEGSFEAQGATAVWRALRNGQRFGKKPNTTTTDDAQLLLTPADVRSANDKLQTMVEEGDELFASEIAEPFAKATKKKMGLRGIWS
jgi:hypothetical protein